MTAEKNVTTLRKDIFHVSVILLSFQAVLILQFVLKLEEFFRFIFNATKSSLCAYAIKLSYST